MMLESCGTMIHIQAVGNGKRKILLLHGWGCDTSLMQPVAAKFSDFQCYIPDFPGHGKSGRPPEPWGVSEYADCLFDIIQRLQLEGCSVIAHSFGCRVVTLLASRYPRIFDKIVLTGAAGIRKPENKKQSARTKHYKCQKKALDVLQKVVLFRKLIPGLREKLIQRYGSPDYAALDSQMRKTFVKVISQDLTEYYSKICCPVLLIWGRDDTETPIWMGRKMEQSIPDAGLVELEGDHFVYLKSLHTFCSIVRSFFSEGQI